MCILPALLLHVTSMCSYCFRESTHLARHKVIHQEERQHSGPYNQPSPPSNIHVFVSQRIMYILPALSLPLTPIHVFLLLQRIYSPGAAQSHPSRRKTAFMPMLPALSLHLIFMCLCYSWVSNRESICFSYLQRVYSPGAASSHPSRRKAAFMSILPALSLHLIFMCLYNSYVLQRIYVSIYRESTHLARHRVIHQEQRQHSCTYCGLSFKDPSGCRRHVRTVHEGIFPYSCGLCTLQFRTKAELENHTARHKGMLQFRSEYYSSAVNKVTVPH